MGKAWHASLTRGRLRPGVVTYHGAMTTLTERETLDLYEKTGALMRGHFRLTSGLHSDIYLQSALVLQYPEHAARLGEALAAPFIPHRSQTVLAPAIGGILVAHEGPRALGLPPLFTPPPHTIILLRLTV